MLAIVRPESLALVSPDDPSGRWSEVGLGEFGAWRSLLRRGAGDAGLAAALGLDRAFVLELAPGVDSEETLSVLRARGDLFEAVSLEQTTAAGLTEDDGDNTVFSPNDPLFKEQYALLNSGQRIGGQDGDPGADLDMLDAWQLSAGGRPVTVAVLDAGVSADHPDLTGKLTPGWNIVSDNDKTTDRYTSHGTHTAGIIAARTSNRLGVASVAPDAWIMPIVVLNKYGFGNEAWLAEGLVWAADHGARVASVSLGFDPKDGDANDQVLRNAVIYATSKGMLICASAGNTPGARIGAPARYPEAMAVGATDNRDQLWNGTSTGPQMSVTAPGVQIWSTWDSVWNDPGEYTYAAKTGTSQACPHVAAVAALVAGVAPLLRTGQIREILERTAEDLGPPGWDPDFGFGRINAGRAVAAALWTKQGDLGVGTTLCVADFNNDGSVDSRDFVEYLRAFAARNWRADLAEPVGVFNTLDLIAYLNAYASGCDF
ncbi:MAG: S8 family serine peptidase [Phycisphaerales bacterium]|nr:S8 family serine peptidase [Phycisphaerales bacterium]